MLVPDFDEYVDSFWRKYGHLKGAALLMAKRHIGVFVEAYDRCHGILDWEWSLGNRLVADDYIIDQVDVELWRLSKGGNVMEFSIDVNHLKDQAQVDRNRG